MDISFSVMQNLTTAPKSIAAITHSPTSVWKLNYIRYAWKHRQLRRGVRKAMRLMRIGSQVFPTRARNNR